MLLHLTGGCSWDSSPRRDASGGGADGRSITVLAASSLTDVFDRLVDQYRSENPEVGIRLAFAGTPAVVAQVTTGAPVDVVATADARAMKRLVELDLVDEPVEFARNHLVLAVQEGNPLGIRDLGDLESEDLTLVVCDVGVPCGTLAERLIESAGVPVRVTAREPNARATLNRLRLGEADAALVYLTDALAADDVDFVELPDSNRLDTAYLAAPTTSSRLQSAADEFVRFLVSPTARRTLVQAGFEVPRDSDRRAGR